MLFLFSADQQHTCNEKLIIIKVLLFQYKLFSGKYNSADIQFYNNVKKISRANLSEDVAEPVRQ